MTRPKAISALVILVSVGSAQMSARGLAEESGYCNGLLAADEPIPELVIGSQRAYFEWDNR